MLLFCSLLFHAHCSRRPAPSPLSPGLEQLLPQRSPWSCLGLSNLSSLAELERSFKSTTLLYHFPASSLTVAFPCPWDKINSTVKFEKHPGFHPCLLLQLYLFSPYPVHCVRHPYWTCFSSSKMCVPPQFWLFTRCFFCLWCAICPSLPPPFVKMFSVSSNWKSS